MKLKRTDSETVEPDTSTVLEHFLKDDAPFSLSIMTVDGSHENTPDSETAYYIVEGDGQIDLGERIIELEPDDVVYIGTDHHTIEGHLKIVAVQSPPTAADAVL
ncbi:MAG: hypothetical protein MUP66_00885 [Candidatus Nanohaloarchaeota archaeon QJJ-5]|nr:hypothetical protein [Candidatus Nanohaloarchaeota archaeon QJJ-5]